MNSDFVANYRGARSHSNAQRALNENSRVERGDMQKIRAAENRSKGTASDDFKNFMNALGQVLTGTVMIDVPSKNSPIVAEKRIPGNFANALFDTIVGQRGEYQNGDNGTGRSVIDLGPIEKYGYGEVTDDDIRRNRRSIGYSAYDDSYNIPFLEGDTLGDVINELGIGTKNGLWGPNGDVAYYTLQLLNQGALDKNGNIRPGSMIKLRRRK